jgi:hypothetical protein
LARGVQADELHALLVRVLRADLVVVGGDPGLELGAAFGQQRGDHADRARGVGHVDDGAVVVRRDLDRGVGAAGGRAADQQRQVEALALHLGGDVAHLLQRRGDQAGQADGLRAVLARGVRIFSHGTITPRSMTS